MIHNDRQGYKGRVRTPGSGYGVQGLAFEILGVLFQVNIFGLYGCYNNTSQKLNAAGCTSKGHRTRWGWSPAAAHTRGPAPRCWADFDDHSRQTNPRYLPQRSCRAAPRNPEFLLCVQPKLGPQLPKSLATAS